MNTASSAMVLGDLAHRGERLWGSHDAFVWAGRRRTYAEVGDRTARLASALSARGVSAGTRVATLSSNHPDVVEFCFAASLLGAVVVPLNTRLSPTDMAFQLDDAGVRYALVHPDLADLAAEAGLSDNDVLMVGDDVDQAVAVHDRLPVNASRPSAAEACIHLYTSGTTGTPKGCLLSQAGWLASNANLAHALGVRPSDRLLGVYPFFHVAGFGNMLAHFTMGATTVIPDSPSAEEVWRLVDEQRLTTLGIPGLRAALQHPMLDTIDASSVRTVYGGAAMESTKTLDLLHEVLPNAVFYGVYGSTEGGNFVTMSTGADERQRPGTIGRPLFGFDVAILDPDDNEVGADVEGELGLRGPSTMIGYWNLAEATAETLRNGWMHSGDLMRADADGFLYFVDRVKDMIKPGGENVYSIEVETALLKHPAVIDCAVIGVPDDKWGEAVKAIVVLDPDGAATVEDLDRHCLDNLAAYKRPRWYEISDSIERSVTNKIVKRDLRARHDPAKAVRLPERS